MKQAQMAVLAKFKAANVKTVREKTTDRVSLIMLAVLRHKYGWGRKRLKAFWENVEEMSQDISNKLLTFEDIQKTLEEEAGVVFE